MTMTLQCWLTAEGEALPVVRNARNYGASGSVRQAQGSITAGSKTLALGAHDFEAGHGILVHGAGPACTLATPEGLTITPCDYGVRTAAHVYSYRIAAVDGNGGCSAAGESASVESPYPLGFAVGMQLLQWTKDSDAPAYYVWRSIDGGAWALAALVDTANFGGDAVSWYDLGTGEYTSMVDGLPTYAPSAPPDVAVSQFLLTSITAGGVASVTLAHAASTTVSAATVDHDDSAALEEACAATGVGERLYVPSGTCNIARNVMVSGHPGLVIEGSTIGTTTLRDNSIWVAPGENIHATFRYGQLSFYRTSVEISRLTFQGNGSLANSPLMAHKAISWVTGNVGSYKMHVHHCTVRDTAGEAIYATAREGSTVRWEHCIAIGSRSTSFNTNTDNTGPACIIEDNEVIGGCGGFNLGGVSIDIRRNTMTGVVAGGGILGIAGCDALVCEDNIIEDCDIHSASAQLVMLGFPGSGNNFDLVGTFRNNVIRSNVINGTDGLGCAVLVADIAGPLMIEGNTVENNRSADTRKSRQVLLSGNTGAVTLRGNAIGAESPAQGITIDSTVPAGAVTLSDNSFEGISPADQVIDER